MTNRSGFTLFAAGLLLLAGAAGAQEPQQIKVDATAPPVEATGVEVRDGAVLLTLDEAVEIALRQNLGLSIQRYTRNRARLGIDQTLGIYDLLARADLYAEDSKSPTISRLQASQSNEQRFNFGFNQLFPTGGNLDLGWSNIRQESNNPFATVNPGYRSGLEFRFVQPLLRDFGRLPTERALLVAQNRSQASREELERQVTVTVQDVIDAYWNLVGARQQLIVAQESLGLAKELHERNRIQVDVGTMAPLELVQSEAAIASNEEQIIRAQQAVGDAEDVLRQLLNLPAGPLWQAEIRPTTDPVMDRVQINLDEAIQAALDSRPEIQRQELAIAQAEIESRYARGQMRPQLDLHLGYNATGTGGDQVVRDPETGAILEVIPGGYGDAFR
ncbi:MAG: TolC family protein, partial [Thermoanaerobaculia bacterium]